MDVEYGTTGALLVEDKFDKDGDLEITYYGCEYSHTTYLSHEEVRKLRNQLTHALEAHHDQPA